MSLPPLPKGPPPQRCPISNPSRGEYRWWQAHLAGNNARYQAEHPEWTPPPPMTPEPAPSLGERSMDVIRGTDR